MFVILTHSHSHSLVAIRFRIVRYFTFRMDFNICAIQTKRNWSKQSDLHNNGQFDICTYATDCCCCSLAVGNGGGGGGGSGGVGHASRVLLFLLFCIQITLLILIPISFSR